MSFSSDGLYIAVADRSNNMIRLVYIDSCTKCSAGRFSSSPTVQAACEGCSSGTYVSGEGASSCLDCPAGKHAPGRGASACVMCSSGQYTIVAGEHVCSNCTAGKFVFGQGASSCLDCPAGKHTPGTGASTCMMCGSGQYVAAAGEQVCSNCTAGKFVSGQGAPSCSVCPTGKYAPGRGASSCVSCSAGQHAATAGQQVCSNCTAGRFYADQGASSCSLCPAGKYAPAESLASCVSCTSGKYAAAAGQQRCSNCTAGTFNSATGAVKCTACARNKYSSAVGAANAGACSDCQAGRFFSGAGAAAASACSPVCEGSKVLETETQSCVCAPGYFQDNENCKLCPPGASCTYPNTNSTSLAVKAKYWRTSSSSTKPVKCPKPEVCLQGGVCAVGYNGTLCMVCAEGYALQSSECAECSGKGNGAIIAVLILGFLVAVICFVLYKKHKKSTENAIKTGAKGKIMLSFMQVLNQIKFVYTIPFPAVLSDFIAGLGFANLDFLSMVGMGCFMPSFNFYDKLLAMTLAPLGLAIALGVKYKLSASEEQRNKCIAWCLKLSYLVFPGVSTVIFQAFPCSVFDDSSSYLKADYSIDCNDPEYPGMATYAMLMTIVYPIGITAMYALLLWRQRKAICPIEGPWRTFLCIKDALPPKLGSTKEEQGILEQRNLNMENNPTRNPFRFSSRSMHPTSGGTKSLSASGASC